MPLGDRPRDADAYEALSGPFPTTPSPRRARREGRDYGPRPAELLGAVSSADIWRFKYGV
jgi:hypothetical protein